MRTDQIWRSEEQAIFALRGLYQRYGYTPYKMSQFEEYDLYVRNKDFLISDRIITFSGEGGKLMALKPDVTLSIVKNAPEASGVVQKVYYSENVYRDYREIMQAGLECVGDLTDYDIAEAVVLAAKSLALLGENYVLDISHTDEQKKVMTCLRQKNTHELRALCQGKPQAEEVLPAIAACRGGAEALEAIAPLLEGAEEQRALSQLRMLLGLLTTQGSRVRLGYYGGVVFRGYLPGIPASVLSGGQYDKLPRKMGRKARAIGFAIYVDLLQELSGSDESFDVDTLILHDRQANPEELLRAAEEGAKEGSVLVSTTLPADRRWKNLIDLRKEAAK